MDGLNGVGKLVLARKEGERIRVGASIDITVKKIRGTRVVLAIEAPREIKVQRGEHLEVTHD